MAKVFSVSFCGQKLLKKIFLLFAVASLIGVSLAFLSYADVDRMPLDASIAEKIPLQLFVMSKCPDAVFCEKAMAPVLQIVSPIINLTTEYIASLEELPKRRFKCLHGEDECLGNVQQLCVRNYYPDPQIWYNFILCQNKKYSEIPSKELWKACADDLKIDKKLIQSCSSGDQGYKLLENSIKIKEEVGVTRSCTILVGGKKRCVRDGGRWYDCPGGSSTAEFVRTICDVYKNRYEKSPKFCDMPEEKE